MTCEFEQCVRLPSTEKVITSDAKAIQLHHLREEHLYLNSFAILAILDTVNPFELRQRFGCTIRHYVRPLMLESSEMIEMGGEVLGLLPERGMVVGGLHYCQGTAEVARIGDSVYLPEHSCSFGCFERS